MSHHPEPSGHAIQGEADGLDIGGQQGQTVCSPAPHSQAAEEATPHLYKQEWKCQTQVRRQLDPGSSREGHSKGVGAGVGDETAEPCGVVHPLYIPLVICPLRRTYVVVIR